MAKAFSLEEIKNENVDLVWCFFSSALLSLYVVYIFCCCYLLKKTLNGAFAVHVIVEISMMISYIAE